MNSQRIVSLVFALALCIVGLGVMLLLVASRTSALGMADYITAIGHSRSDWPAAENPYGIVQCTVGVADAGDTSYPNVCLHATGPIVTSVAYFGASLSGCNVLLMWETASEVDTLGFNLYRAESLSGSRTKLNDTLIPAQAPGSPVGAIYQFLDEAVVLGTTYYYWLEEIYVHGGVSLYGPVVVTVEEPISGLSATNDSPTPFGAPTTLTATIDAGSNVTYTWIFGDGGTGSGAVVFHIYSNVGVYTTIVTANNTVSELTATTRVVVDEIIAGLIAVNDGPSPWGRPTALTATVTAGSNVTYIWAFGDWQLGSGAVVTHTYPDVGSYSAIVTASNSVSELAETTRVIVDEIIAGLSAVNDSPSPRGRPTTFTATVTAGSNTTYAWAFGDGQLGSGAVVTHTYADVGSYSPVVTASNSVSEFTATTTVTITWSYFSIYLPLGLRSAP